MPKKKRSSKKSDPNKPPPDYWEKFWSKYSVVQDYKKLTHENLEDLRDIILCWRGPKPKEYPYAKDIVDSLFGDNKISEWPKEHHRFRIFYEKGWNMESWDVIRDYRHIATHILEMLAEDLGFDSLKISQAERIFGKYFIEACGFYDATVDNMIYPYNWPWLVDLLEIFDPRLRSGPDEEERKIIKEALYICDNLCNKFLTVSYLSIAKESDSKKKTKLEPNGRVTYGKLKETLNQVLKNAREKNEIISLQQAVEQANGKLATQKHPTTNSDSIKNHPLWIMYSRETCKK
jgi:hypothetical protein